MIASIFRNNGGDLYIRQRLKAIREANGEIHAMKLICKIFGHRESVVWNMNKLTGRFCTRCKTWTSSKHS